MQEYIYSAFSNVKIPKRRRYDDEAEQTAEQSSIPINDLTVLNTTANETIEPTREPIKMYTSAHTGSVGTGAVKWLGSGVVVGSVGGLAVLVAVLAVFVKYAVS